MENISQTLITELDIMIHSLPKESRTVKSDSNRTRIRHKIMICRIRTSHLYFVFILCFQLLWNISEAATANPIPKCSIDDPQIGVLPDIRQRDAFTEQDNIYSIRDCAQSCCRTPECSLAFFGNGLCLLFDCTYSTTVCELTEGSDDMYVACVIKNSTIGSRIDTPSYPRQTNSRHKDSVDDPGKSNQEVTPSQPTETKPSSSTSPQPTDGPAQKEPVVEEKKEGATTVPTIAPSPVIQLTTKTVSQTTETGVVTTTVTVPSADSGGQNKSVVVLTVSANGNKVVQLPKNHITLHAFVVPEEPPNGGKYHYDWKPVSTMPEENAATMQKDGKEIALSDLQAGLYTFEIHVSAPSAEGVGYVNVSVLPPPRENTPPVAVVLPSNNLDFFENTDSILDATESYDDFGDLTYLWEVIESPITEGLSTGTKDLYTLHELSPGFYQFRLTVTDVDGASNSTMVNVTVKEEPDSDPSANAGADQAIHLPTDHVILNGNLSSDDHGIVRWEWTKLKGGLADISGSAEPVFKASKLQQGIYTFQLTVYDRKEHQGSDTVNVHVLSEDNNKPPVADAGPHKELSLPDDSTSLEGGGSTDDVAIITYEWTKIKGPESDDFVINDADKAEATVSGLVAGTYTFKLTVTDALKETNSATTQVVVKEEVNMDPVSNAGQDITVELPTDYAELDGSLSSDDKGIISYSWSRDAKSPAAGVSLGNSQTSPILKVAQLVSGIYVFNLTVTDAKGRTSSDIATVTVKDDPHSYDLVELVFDEDASAFRESEKKDLVVFLQLLVGGEVVLQEISHTTSGRLLIIFYATNTSDGRKPIPGPKVIQSLKESTRKDSTFLKMTLLSYDTVVCQKNCSNHGTCDKFSRKCICETFWTQSFIRIYLGDGQSNCDWSILYVIIIAFLLMMFLGAVTWFMFCCCRRKRRKSKRKHQYSLLTEDLEGNDVLELLPKANGKQNSSIMVSASGEDTDDEITVYEHRKKRNRSEKKALNGHIKRSKRYPGRTEKL